MTGDEFVRRLRRLGRERGVAVRFESRPGKGSHGRGERRAIPRPSPAHGRPLVALPALVAAKIALYGAMHAQGVSNTALAVRLGLSEGAVRRLLDLDHRSHIGQVEAALHELGQSLTIATRAA